MRLFAKEIESKAIEINGEAKPGAWDCQDPVSWSSFYTFFEKTKQRGPSIWEGSLLKQGRENNIEKQNTTIYS